MESTPSAHVTAGSTAANQSYIRNRIYNFSVTMIVMGASFVLYYLGLFGGVDGPLEPAAIGAKLASRGITRNDLFIVFLLLTGLGVTWNWIVNAIARLIESRRGPSGSTSSSGFRPIRKGAVSHVLWILAATFTVMLYLRIYGPHWLK